MDCGTRYPILLVHGMAFRDEWRSRYWGRIPETLRQRGAVVYFGGQDAIGTVEGNAAHLVRRIGEICRDTGCGRVNIIAHSKGGIDARAAALVLGSERVASLTTVSTPHRGSRTLDYVFRLPRALIRFWGFFVNLWYRLLGDREPDFYAVMSGFTTDSMAEFNRRTPDSPGILYRSAGGVMASPVSDASMWFSRLVIGLVDGPNDGLVTVESARWGEEFRLISSATRRGVSHLDEVDIRRAPISGGEDICDFYAQLVAELRERGL